MPTFPLDLLAWLDPIRAEQQVFDLGEGLTVQNRTAGGEVLRSGGAARLWYGTLNLTHRTHAAGRALQAKLHVLRAAGASFYIGDMTQPSGSAAAVLNSVQASGAINIISGPANYPIPAGTYIAIDYAGRRGLHQIADSPGGFALGSTGTRNGVEIVPPLRPGWTAGQAITIGGAKCRAVMVPGSLRIGQSQGMRHEGASFDWIQTLRENP